ncbi:MULTISPECIES: NEL-type E3 ubiquitin ligase domain-containing protein [unclassified Pseudomonas]|uniref:NEL-type E3 ubiquitin ligase domain-containing protein n=1 Tax=unclassified Pseudomonas TaxID=196821 RepID=UPI000A1F0A0B|nr:MULTISPECIES: NEL-type E3 ubiquitin ligase domain-containing protein [unclassified Pseudomonas]
MSNFHTNINNLKTTSTPQKGRHYDFIKNNIHDTFKHTSLHRALALNAAALKKPSWHEKQNHAIAKAANLIAWQTQNQTDEVLGKIKTLEVFAVHLLKNELKKKFGLLVDVKQTYLRLYFPKKTPWYTINLQPGFSSRTVSLLDAALHNFASNETFTADSDFISKPDENGHFDILNIKQTLSIEQFKRLCRELDIGKRYTRYLRHHLLPRDPGSRAAIEHQTTQSQKATLIFAAHLALLTNDIGANAHDVILGIADGQTGLTLGGKVMQCCELSILDATLTGIILFTPVEQQSAGEDRMIAYVPHDPEHPLKEYASSLEFVKELTRQLRANESFSKGKGNYWRFFSQFIDQQQRGHFFATLEQRLSEFKWLEKKDPLDPGPTWHPTPVEKPYLAFDARPITQNLWKHQYQRKIDKIFNDARDIAVSTEIADRNSRWAWWDNFEKILSDIFNAALLVITPFVPFLGELMLAYTAYQIATDVFEGIVDMTQENWTEMGEHLVGIVTDIAQLAAFAAGAAIGSEFRLKLSPLIDGMQPVISPDGNPRLWHPDLVPYELAGPPPPPGSRRDAKGLFQHAGKNVLSLDGKTYEVRQDSHDRQYRIQHPQRPQAYAPKLRYNGRGAWTHEGENPGDWPTPKLMRRLGPATEGFSDWQLENIRQISGTEAHALRQMYVDNDAPPLLLEDTLERFRASRDTATTSADIRAGRSLDPSSYWFEQMVTELPGWPADCALKVNQSADERGPAHTYGNTGARPSRTLTISLADVMAGRLPEHVTGFLSDAQLERLLGARLPKTDQIKALRDLLADRVDAHQSEISQYLYGYRTISSDPRVLELQRQYPHLPTAIAKRLVEHARQPEVEALDNGRRLPLDFKSAARECAFETRTTRAWEGFIDNQRLTSDTERLALNVLRLHSDAYRDLRIDIREGSLDGPLRCSVGAEHANEIRVLLHDGHARYEIFDGNRRPLFGPADLYESILRAIPEQARQQTGYRSGQGRVFKQWLMEMSESPRERRTQLLEPSIRPVVQTSVENLLRGPIFSRMSKPIEQRVKELYPELSDREVDFFVNSLPTGRDALETVKDLETELKKLNDLLDDWKQSQAAFDPDGPGIIPSGARTIADRILACFKREAVAFNERRVHYEAGYTLDLSAELMGPDLEKWWKTLPDLKPWFDQVTTLDLNRARFSPAPGGLLKHFPNVRHLSARQCGLKLLPPHIAKMTELETLQLKRNQIRLTEESWAQLRDLTRLRTLRLSLNQLGRAPDVSRMPDLITLELAYAGIDTWPEGLFTPHRRPRGFFLDLSSPAIVTVPQVEPGSPDAWLVARARLAVSYLEPEARETFYQYRESVGLPRQNNYSLLAAEARKKWHMSDSSLFWADDSPGLTTFRNEAWDNLMHEPGSQGFFQIIDSLTRSADYQEGGTSRQILTRRVWDLIDAMDLDTELRKKLFRTAEEPTTCADASSEVFNIMGVQALVSRAYSYSTSGSELEGRLVKLARAATRLERVNEIARADALSRPSREEEVEIYLAYQTRLNARLDLPWQSEQMLYEGVAGVTQASIDNACITILELETGDGLVNGMLEQPFWEHYLRDTQAAAYKINDESYERQLSRLEQRHSPDAVLPLNDEEYTRELTELAYRRLGLGRSLTTTLMRRHGLLPMPS